MFKKEFDILQTSDTSVEETIKKLKKIGVPIDNVRLDWIYDRNNNPVTSCLVFSGKGFMPTMILKLSKRGLEHHVLEGRHTFM